MTSQPGPGPREAGREHLPSWNLDGSLMVSAVAGVVLAALGLALGRPQLVALAVPLVLSAVWSTTHRPTGVVGASSEAEITTVRSSGLDNVLVVSAPAGVSMALVRAQSPGTPTLEALLALRTGTRTLRLRTPSVRTGTRELFTIGVVASAEEGGWTQGPWHVPPARVLVLPRTGRLDLVPVSRQLRGLTGPHSSRRLGDGTAMRDVAPLRPGDSPRRIDWRATARRSPELDQLYVRRTFAPSEASVVLVVDSRDDVGPRVLTWGGYQDSAPEEQTSLDVAREAAAAIARAVVEAGDRVGLEDLGRLSSPLPLAGGKRHLKRVTYALALCRPFGAPRTRARAPQIPTGALVYLFSTFLDDSASAAAQQWLAHGHTVIAVDTLPPASLSGLTERETYAWRLTDVVRQDRLITLARSGVTVLRWSPESSGTELRAAARAELAHGRGR